MLDESQVETIHQATLALLAEHGIELMHGPALALFRAAGALVDDETQIVRIGPDLVDWAVAQAPGQVTLTPRNPDQAVTFGDGSVNFGLVSGPPNVHDRLRGRRAAGYADYCELLKLAQSLGIVHMLGVQAVPPTDLPVDSRHLDCLYANLTLTDRAFGLQAIGAARVRDAVAMMAIARGLTTEQLRDSPSGFTVINVNSPRRLDGPLSEGLIAMVEAGQPVAITPFTLMGAMTPVTLGAALVQQNAEALAGVVLTQLVRPGAPLLYGAFTSNVDMKSGAPAFGTPENASATLAAGQLARRYDLPYRASNANAANAVDAQAAYESQMSLWSAVLGGADLVNHAAGWMEGGLTASYEKLMLDAEMLQMLAETLRPVATDPDSLGLEAIAAVPPGGHFFGEAHTLARYETAFYQPLLSDWRNHEAWLEAGAPTAEARATEVWQALLEAYAPPPLDPAVHEALEAYMVRRKREIAETGI